MLRTQEAALYSVGSAGIADLCEAICLDAIEVARATRVSIWFFADDGSMVCQRMVDSTDGRIQQGAVIPPEATEAYLDAARTGLEATVSDNAPALHGSATDRPANRLDLLLVDGVSQPAAVFRCERPVGEADWSDRDLYVVRNLAQTLAATVRREAGRQARPQRPAATPAPLPDKAVPRRDVIRPPMGMVPQNLARLGLERPAPAESQAIRLPRPAAAGELPDGDESFADLPPRWLRDKGDY